MSRPPHERGPGLDHFFPIFFFRARMPAHSGCIVVTRRGWHAMNRDRMAARATPMRWMLEWYLVSGASTSDAMEDRMRSVLGSPNSTALDKTCLAAYRVSLNEAWRCGYIQYE